MHGREIVAVAVAVSTLFVACALGRWLRRDLQKINVPHVTRPAVALHEAQAAHTEAKKALAHALRHEELGTMPSRMVSAVRRREAEAAKSLRAAIAADPEGAGLLAAKKGPQDAVRHQFVSKGYVKLPSAANTEALAPLQREIDGARCELTRGGYRIWSPASALPPALRAWSETEGVEILQRALPRGACVRCIGGAALVKSCGVHVGTPFHQDGAYAAEDDGARSGGKPVFALWLALSPTGPASGCLRFAPSLGFELLPHDRKPRERAPDGFENFLAPAEAKCAEQAAVNECMQPGDALIIGSRVVHGSHAAIDAERVAFSPLYELECEDLIWFAGEGGAH